MDSGIVTRMLVGVHLEELRAQADARRQSRAARPAPHERPNASAGRLRRAVGARLVRAGLRIGANPSEAAVGQCRPECG
jgi:hypothetical protein